MAQGTGLAAQIGYAEETTWGTTPGSPSWRWLEHTQESLRGTKGTYEGKGLRAGKSHRRGSRRIITRRSAAGSVTHEVPTLGLGVILKHMLDSAATPVQQGATPAYLQTHATVAGALLGKGLTIQKGVPRTNGTVDAYTYTGAKVTQWELSISNDGVLMLELSFDAKEESDDVALATAAYPTGTRLFSFTGASLTLAGSPPANVRDLKIRQEISRADERHFLSGAGLKAEQLEDDYRKTTGTLEAEYTSKTVYDAFQADTSLALVATFTGQVISGIYSEQLVVTLPDVRLEGEAPAVGGPGIVTQNAGFTAYDPDSGAAPVTITYQSTDTAL